MIRNAALIQLLTPRETQVLKLLSTGISNKGCALQLGCSTRTVEAHRANIFKKLNVKNAVEMVMKIYVL